MRDFRLGSMDTEEGELLAAPPSAPPILLSAAIRCAANFRHCSFSQFLRAWFTGTFSNFFTVPTNNRFLSRAFLLILRSMRARTFRRRSFGIGGSFNF